MELYIGNTFWASDHSRTIEQTMDEITARGINVVRFPIAPQTLDANDPQGRAPNLKNYESVRVENSRLAMEQFIVLADQYDIQVMLDIHSCSNYVGWRAGRLDARPPYADADRDNYDFYREDSSCAASGNPSGVTRIQAYNQSTWLNNLRTLAGLEADLGVDNIIGIDIFNEPWDYTWAEWSSLSAAAYQAINEVNPNLLVFIQGISASAGNQDGTPDSITEVPHGVEATNPNWGENLFEAGDNPPNIPRDQLVYSPHTYGPSVFVQKMFMDPAQPECEGLEGDAAGDAGCSVVTGIGPVALPVFAIRIVGITSHLELTPNGSRSLSTIWQRRISRVATGPLTRNPVIPVVYTSMPMILARMNQVGVIGTVLMKESGVFWT